GKWLKKVGDPIAKDEPIVEIITDKINIELPSPAAGTLGAIAVPEGQVAQVGDPLGQILAAGESASAAPAAPKPAAAAGSPAPQPAATQPARETAGAPAPSRPAPSSAPAYATAVDAPPSTDGQRLSPAVRKLAKEHQVDVGQISGSGMGGRVTREDVLTHLEARKVAASAPSQAATA